MFPAAGCDIRTAVNPSSMWQLPVHTALNARMPTLHKQRYYTPVDRKNLQYFINYIIERHYIVYFTTPFTSYSKTES